MALGRRFLLYLKSLNPDSYSQLCEDMSVSSVFGQFFFTFFLIFLMMFALFIPAAIIGSEEFHARLAGFDQFTLGGNFSSPNPVTLVDNPLIVADLDGNATFDGEKLLLTKEGITWKTFYWFGESSLPWSELNDFKALPPNGVTALFVFFAPAFAFWGGLLLLAKYLFLIAFVSILGFFLPRFFKFVVSFSQTLKIALFSSAIMMSVEMLLFPFYRNFWLPLALFVCFFVIGLILVGERDLSESLGPHHKKKQPPKEVWD